MFRRDRDGFMMGVVVRAWGLIGAGALLMACGGTEKSKATSDAGGDTSTTTEAGGASSTGVGGSGGSAASGGSTSTSAGGGETGSIGGSGGTAGSSGGEGGSAGTATTGGAGGTAGSGGTSGTGGTGGTGGAPSAVTSVPLAGGETEKVDLLFVIDNSISMADKQELFQTGVPTLVERLINPMCIGISDPDEAVLVADPSDDCPEGFEREFEPLNDLHVGIISTSLGGHGGDICSPNGSGTSSWNETKNDRAHLMPTVRPNDGLLSYEDLGFLAWDPDGELTPPGESDVTSLVADFQSQVVATGEAGCGYEAPLESWYRFLIDPAPSLDLTVVNNAAVPVTDDDGNVIIDETLLEQRAAFLRPDSVVAIIMLTDENDCSVVDGGVGWLTAQATTSSGSFTMPQATSACDSDPNDACCRSCALSEAQPPSGCVALSDDEKCQTARPSGSDALNLRCFNQKQRFGFDLLYPVERYIEGLSSTTVMDTHDCDATGCRVVPNPLFVSDDGQVRSASRVVLTGIVGVPWEDLATPESLSGGQLRYMTPEALAAAGRWNVVLGDPPSGVPPTDPLMIESPDPRTGTNPVTMDALAPETSTDPTENPINGHEYVNNDNGDLQYACIFPLETPRVCTDELEACDCTDTDVPKNRPLCNPPGGGAAGTTQYFGKAYPAPRILEVIRGLGARAMPASICPRTTTGNPASPGFGYNPAVDAVIRRIEAGLGASCVDELAADVDTTLACRVLEVGARGCDCALPGRRALPDAVQAQVDAELAALCAQRGDDCSDYCACEVVPLAGADKTACMTEVEPSTGDGWCYISPGQGIGSEELVEHCPEDRPRTVRVIGAPTELTNTELRLYCQ